MSNQNYRDNQAVRELYRCDRRTAKGICDKPITDPVSQTCDYWRDHIEES
jgi:hypothetical protein